MDTMKTNKDDKPNYELELDSDVLSEGITALVELELNKFANQIASDEIAEGTDNKVSCLAVRDCILYTSVCETLKLDGYNRKLAKDWIHDWTNHNEVENPIIVMEYKDIEPICTSKDKLADAITAYVDAVKFHLMYDKYIIRWVWNQNGNLDRELSDIEGCISEMEQ
jgi:hypothetical protein